MRSTLIVLSIAALLAIGAGSAPAKLSGPGERAPAARGHSPRADRWRIRLTAVVPGGESLLM